MRQTLPMLLRAGCAAALIATAACTPQDAAWSPAQANKSGSVHRVSDRTLIPTANGRLTRAGQAALHDFLATKGAPHRLWVTLRPAGDAGMEGVEQLERALLNAGVQASKITRGPVSRQGSGVHLRVERWVAATPDCPDWSRATTLGNNNLPSSNFGCAVRRNLMLMVDDPRDLERGRRLGPANGGLAAEAVGRYRARETEPLLETNTTTVVE